MSEQLFTCDLCTKALFHSKEALRAHVDERHSSFTPLREELEAFALQLKPNLTTTIASSGERWKMYGRRTFEAAVSRDAGPQRLGQACEARSQLELIAKKWRPNAEVYVFGSSVAMGLWDGLSDIDCTVVDVAALDKQEWPPNEKAAVRSLAAIFRSIGFTFQNLEAIEHARVPIIKHNASVPAVKVLGEKYERLLARSVRCLFDVPQSPNDRVNFEEFCRSCTQELPESVWWDAGNRSCGVTLTSAAAAITLLLNISSYGQPITAAPIHEEFRPDLFHVDFDLSFRTFGIRNSHLLRAFLGAHPCARPGALVLKDWSKSSGVNNSINGFLTSYAVNILWIFFLFQKGHVPYVDPKSIPAGLSSSGQDKNPVYMPLIPPTMDAAALEALHENMGRLLFEFFAYYVFEFDWDAHVVSLNKATLTTKAELGWTENDEVRLSKRNVRYSMCIEDPYEENLNLGRHLGECRCRKIMNEFRRGLSTMLHENPENSVLFSESKKKSSGTNPALSDVTRLLAAAATSPMEGEVPVAQFRQYLENACPSSLEKVLEHWEWKEVVRRLGYKQVAGHVFPVRSLTGRKPLPPAEVAKVDPEPDVTRRLIDEFVEAQSRREPSVVPEWVLWHPPTVPLPPPPQNRIVKSSWVAPTSGVALARQLARLIL